jgi:uncharacterized protein (DUF433 family)
MGAGDWRRITKLSRLLHKRLGGPDGVPAASAPVMFSRQGGAHHVFEPGKRSGQPCIRGLRITVSDVLNWPAAGMTEREILDDYPELEQDDLRAVCEFAAKPPRRTARGRVSRE